MKHLLPTLRFFAFILSSVVGLLLVQSGCRQRQEPFPVATYFTAPDNLQGNRYTLEAEIDAQINWREGVGRIIAVRALRQDARLPVFIADALKVNLLVAQRYRMELTVRKGGLLYIERLEKL